MRIIDTFWNIIPRRTHPKEFFAILSPCSADGLPHHCHIFEMNGESYRFKQSVQKGNHKKK
ncbi:MAG: hypothetical protein ACYSTF_00095 [Planctomycetota bacterium]